MPIQQPEHPKPQASSRPNLQEQISLIVEHQIFGTHYNFLRDQSIYELKITVVIFSAYIFYPFIFKETIEKSVSI